MTLHRLLVLSGASPLECTPEPNFPEEYIALSRRFSEDSANFVRATVFLLRNSESRRNSEFGIGFLSDHVLQSIAWCLSLAVKLSSFMRTK